MLSSFQKFFAPTDGSIKGMLNPEELYRSILASLGSGTVIGIAIILLQAILTNVGQIFPNPTVASLATAFLTLVLDLLRRQNHGTTPVTGTVTVPVTPAVTVIPAVRPA